MKPKLYFLLSNVTALEPISGDRINEMNLIRSLSNTFDVYYNNVLVEPLSSIYGDPKTAITLPNRKYDCHYVRANRDIFLQLPHPKIWMCVPYFEDCYREADAVSCITQHWADRLASYNQSFRAKELFCGAYPDEIAIPKKILVTHQVVDTSVFASATGDNDELIRYKEPDKITIGHFGRVVKSNYPFQLIEMAKTNRWAKFEAIFIGHIKEELPAEFKIIDFLPSEDIPGAIQSCDYIIYSQDKQGEIAGSLKVMEAMACGVPVISPRYRAREHELGVDYPYFWEFEEGTDITKPVQKGFDRLMDFIVEHPEQRQVWGKKLLEHSKKFDIKDSAGVLADQFLSIM